MAIPNEVWQAGGAVAGALLIIKEVRHWTTSMMKARNNKKIQACIDNPRCQEALTLSILSKEALGRLEKATGETRDQSIKQTSCLEQSVQILTRIELGLSNPGIKAKKGK